MSDTDRPRVLVTRPLPQAERTAEKLRAAGYEPVLAPMLRVEPIEPPVTPNFAAVQAVLVTSSTGLERLAALTRNRDCLILTVGDRTASAARKAGFQDVVSASGDGTALLALTQSRLTPEAGPVIHVRGVHSAVEFTKLSADGYDFHECIAYEAVSQPKLPTAALAPLPAAALIYSERTAQALAQAIQNAELDPTEIAYVGISEAALAPLLTRGAVTKAAKAPNEAALLAALVEIDPAGLKN